VRYEKKPIEEERVQVGAKPAPGRPVYRRVRR
jgi:hypothetical protein